MVPEFQEMLRHGQINIKTDRRLGQLAEADQRDRLNAGPPYEGSPAPAPAEQEVGNSVSNGTEHGQGQELGDPVSTSAENGDGQELGDLGLDGAEAADSQPGDSAAAAHADPAVGNQVPTAARTPQRRRKAWKRSGYR